MRDGCFAPVLAFQVTLTLVHVHTNNNNNCEKIGTSFSRQYCVQLAPAGSSRTDPRAASLATRRAPGVPLALGGALEPRDWHGGGAASFAARAWLCWVRELHTATAATESHKRSAERAYAARWFTNEDRGARIT